MLLSFLSSRSSLLLVAAGLSALAIGCTDTVDAVGGSGGSGATGTTGTTGTGGAGNSGGQMAGTTGTAGQGQGGMASSTASTGGQGGAAVDGIALLYSQFPVDPGTGGTGNSSVATGGGPDPNTLFVLISDPGASATCADPYSYPCDNHWQVSVGIPPAYQKVGTLQLSDPQFLSYYSISLTCNSGGGGSFDSGTMEILSIDATQVTVRFQNTDTFDIDANGDHVASRCP